MGISKYAWGKIVPFPAFLGVMRDLWRTLRSLGVAVSGKCWSWKPPSGCKGADLTPLFLYDLHSVVSKHLTGISSSQRDRKHSFCFRGGNRNIEITRKKNPWLALISRAPGDQPQSWGVLTFCMYLNFMPEGLYLGKAALPTQGKIGGKVSLGCCSMLMYYLWCFHVAKIVHKVCH